AVRTARRRLGARARSVNWLEQDITNAALPEAAYAVWHDRAVFHFLTAEADRRAYVRAVTRAVKSGGQVIVATFAQDGPTRCSGLPVRRYSANELHAEFGESFTLEQHERVNHDTPSGAVQRFVYCRMRRRTT